MHLRSRPPDDGYSCAIPCSADHTTNAINLQIKAHQIQSNHGATWAWTEVALVIALDLKSRDQLAFDLSSPWG